MSLFRVVVLLMTSFMCSQEQWSESKRIVQLSVIQATLDHSVLP